MDGKMTVKLGGIVWNHGTETAMVILEDASSRGYALPIAPAEASAVILEMQGSVPFGPAGYRTVETMLKQCGATPLELRIYAASPVGVYISLRYRRGWRLFDAEVSPGDALCLSLALRCPITIMSALWQALIAPKPGAAENKPETELLFVRPGHSQLHTLAG